MATPRIATFCLSGSPRGVRGGKGECIYFGKGHSVFYRQSTVHRMDCPGGARSYTFTLGYGSRSIWNRRQYFSRRQSTLSLAERCSLACSFAKYRLELPVRADFQSALDRRITGMRNSVLERQSRLQPFRMGLALNFSGGSL